MSLLRRILPALLVRRTTGPVRSPISVNIDTPDPGDRLGRKTGKSLQK